MLIESTAAAKLLGVSRSYAIRLFKALGIRPDRQGKRGDSDAAASLWGARHVLAIMLLPVLEKLGVGADSAIQVAQRVGLGFTSDEQAEAVLSSGRCYLMIAARVAAPELFYLENLKDAERELSAGLARMGATVQKVNIGVLWEQIQTAARALRDQNQQPVE
jgi:hypothetical protein